MQYTVQKSKRVPLVGNKVFIAVLLASAAVLVSLQLAQWKKRAAIEKEVASLQQEARELEQRNSEISDSLAFLGTTSATERIARQQLNMKKEGEIVVNFGEPNETQGVPVTQIEKISNKQLWLDYFFK